MILTPQYILALTLFVVGGATVTLGAALRGYAWARAGHDLQRHENQSTIVIVIGMEFIAAAIGVLIGAWLA